MPSPLRCTLVLSALTFGGCRTAVSPVVYGEGGLEPVSVTRHDDARRVDISIGGKPFTSYIYPGTIKKPVLFPLRSAAGTIVTRGFPLEPRAGERADHPHQVGAWFTYGDVNGIDFWGYSDATPAEELATKGTIVHKAVTRTTNGPDRGELDVTADWAGPDGSILLSEETQFVFRGDAVSRRIDRTTRWTARDKRIVFNDTKEGAFGIRVARSLEQPSNEPAVFADGRGHTTTVPALDNDGVTGLYRSSEGRTGDDVWGTRARWVMLSGTVERERVTLAILDHPANPGFPTYWHARGYGLFAANPLGQAGFTNGKARMNFALDPGGSATFQYRILVASGAATPDAVESEYKTFAGIQANTAAVAGVKVLCSNAFGAAMQDLAPKFEATMKQKVSVTYGLAANLRKRIESAESFDLAVLTPAAIDDLIKAGRIAADSRTPLARTGLALAIRAGAKKRDISTVDAFKRVLLGAKSIAYAKEGASGVAFAALIDRLGIANELRTKSLLASTGEEVSQLVVGGQAELGVLPVSEILPVRGVQVLGAFPADAQTYIVMVAGVSSASKQGDVARKLIRFLAAPAALPVIKAKGMERVVGSP
jgi:molybdenum ABC transporter molybdate-binding protein